MNWISAIVPVLGKYVYPTALLVQTLSIYITVLVAVQRYACLCRPYRASLSCQRQQVRRYIISITVFAVLFTLPRYFEYDAVPTSEPLSTEVLQNYTATGTTTTTDDDLLTTWDVAQTDFSKNRIYRIVYFNLHPLRPVHAEAEHDQSSCCRQSLRASTGRRSHFLFQPGRHSRNSDLLYVLREKLEI